MTQNLGAPQVADNQAQKEQTINDAVGRLDAAMTDTLTLTFVGGDNTATLVDDDFLSHFQLDCQPDGTTPPDGDCTLTVPAIRRGAFAVTNGTAETITVQIDSQPVTPGTVAAGSAAMFFCDGTNVWPL